MSTWKNDNWRSVFRRRGEEDAYCLQFVVESLFSNNFSSTINLNKPVNARLTFRIFIIPATKYGNKSPDYSGLFVKTKKRTLKTKKRKIKKTVFIVDNLQNQITFAKNYEYWNEFIQQTGIWQNSADNEHCNGNVYHLSQYKRFVMALKIRRHWVFNFFLLPIPFLLCFNMATVKSKHSPAAYSPFLETAVEDVVTLHYRLWDICVYISRRVEQTCRLFYRDFAVPVCRNMFAVHFDRTCVHHV